MKVLIIGTGAVGSVIAKQLSKDKDVSEIICGDKNEKIAREFLRGVNKVELRKIDASNTSNITKNAKDVDVIINSSLPDFNLKIMEAALKTGSNYQDLTSALWDLKTPEQLSYHKRFEKEKLVGLINTGVGPGLSNLLAKEGADKLNIVETINIRFIEEQKASELIFAWSPIGTLDQITAPPLVYKNGKFQVVKPFSENEKYNYPLPFGERNATIIYGDEVSTIPRFIKVRNVEVKSTGTDIEFAKALYKLGLFSKKSIKVQHKSIVPIEFFKSIMSKTPTPSEMNILLKNGVIEDAEFGLVVDIIGRAKGRKTIIKNYVIFPTLKEIQKKVSGATYISYPTGLCAALFTKLIKKLEKKGVYPPEALEKEIRKDFLLELEGNGIVVNEQFRSLSRS